MSTIKDEIFYHVFQRSFFDSNNDRHGDFIGLKEKIPYLKWLGIDSIILLPIYESIFYHNYFAADFRKIDPKYGNIEEFHELVNALHNVGIKIYLDMEYQYVSEDHIWFSDSFQNPTSKYSDYIVYSGPDNSSPESIIFNLNSVESYSGIKKKVATVNMNNPQVYKAIKNEFRFWLDPHGDGSLKDGVDGFRLDHLMDDLDSKGLFTNLLGKFWKPLIMDLRELNPEVKIIGEQGDWSASTEDYFSIAGVDLMLAFPLKHAISDWNKNKIIEEGRKLTFGSGTVQFNKEEINKDRSNEQTLDRGSEQKLIVFIENHDTDRFASIHPRSLGKLKLAAILNLLLAYSPSIYYGQELGMKGKGGFEKFGVSDGNDIPRREAFPWNASIHSKGTALWYKDSGPWWDQTFLKDHDGISVDEQEGDENSLLNFYRKLIKIRKENDAFKAGSLRFFEISNNSILGFERKYSNETFQVFLNLSNENVEENLNNNDIKYSNGTILSSEGSSLDQLKLYLGTEGFLIIKMNDS